MSVTITTNSAGGQIVREGHFAQCGRPGSAATEAIGRIENFGLGENAALGCQFGSPKKDVKEPRALQIIEPAYRVHQARGLLRTFLKKAVYSIRQLFVKVGGRQLGTLFQAIVTVGNEVTNTEETIFDGTTCRESAMG